MSSDNDYAYNDDWNYKLVKEIERHPCLYNPLLPRYANSQYCQMVWQKIAKAMNDTVPACKEKWRNIRGAFVKNVNLEPGRRRPRRPYYMFDRLKFLLPHINKREKKGNSFNMSHDENESEDSSEESDNDSLSADEKNFKRKHPASSSKTSIEAKKIRNGNNSLATDDCQLDKNLEHAEETSFSIENNSALDPRLRPEISFTQKNSQDNGVDAFDHFGKYVAAQLRQMATRQSVMLQMEIQKTITRAILNGLPNGTDVSQSSSSSNCNEITLKCENLCEDLDEDYVKIKSE